MFAIDDKSGNLITASRDHDQRVLCSGSEGRVYTADKQALLDEGKFVDAEWNVFTHPEGRGVAIRSVEHGRLLAFSRKGLYMMDKVEDTAWDLEPADGVGFSLLSPEQATVAAEAGHEF